MPAWAFPYAARLHKRASERRLPLRAFVYARRPLKAARSGHCSRSLLSRGSTVSTHCRLLRRRRSTRARRCAPLWATSAKQKGTAPRPPVRLAAALRRSAARSVRPPTCVRVPAAGGGPGGASPGGRRLHRCSIGVSRRPAVLGGHTGGVDPARASRPCCAHADGPALLELFVAAASRFARPAHRLGFEGPRPGCHGP